MNKHYAKIAEDVFARINLEKLKNKSVLITGANGLLGSHMANVLAYGNDHQNFKTHVTCTSRNTVAPWLKDLFKSSQFKFIQADLVSDKWPFENEGFDYGIHAATYGQPKKFLENPLQTMILNSTVTARLLEIAARKNGSFLFMSSSEIYGNPPKDFNPTKEEYPGNVSPVDQRSPYTSSKRFAETLCKVYNDLKKVKARVARVSSVYGPGVNLTDDRVLNVFIRRALEQKELKLMDRGEQKRRWLYISDALVMLFHILLHSKELVYNVGGTDLRSIGELAAYIGEQTGVPVIFPAKETIAQHTAGAPSVIDIDNQLIMTEASMKKLVPLQEGLKSCVSWNQDLLGGNSLA